MRPETSPVSGPDTGANTGRGQQLPLDLPHRPALGRDDFLVSPCNSQAVDWIDQWPQWPGGILAISGPVACGKSHLIEVWRSRTQAVRIGVDELKGDAWMHLGNCIAIDDIAGPLPEEALLHAINWVRAHEATLLLAGNTPPSGWDITLPDLRSRLLTIPVAPISLPDDALLDALIVKQFADRQLRVGPDIVAFLRLRIERSFAAVQHTVSEVDRRALAEKRSITLPFVRKVLEDEDKKS